MLTVCSKNAPVKLTEGSHRGGVMLKRLSPTESCDRQVLL